MTGTTRDDITQRRVTLLQSVWLPIGGHWYPGERILIDAFWQTSEPPQGVWISRREVQSSRGHG
ncbi:hypothetical protein [Roseomonas sp. HF4]|uniref:hypothetical protein n=1 Tax=Roseomonas sp. HF4 TaxID=2562313 RepID=UPI0010BF6B20|nr:hypothetical protein [Roseomonas sp. HF4]